jgi:hypothetical protein
MRISLSPGRIFMICALIWCSGAFYLLRPDLNAPPKSMIVLEDGTRHRLYSVREALGMQLGAQFAPFAEPPEYTFSEFFERPLLKFITFALLPPLAVVIAAVTYVSVRR